MKLCPFINRKRGNFCPQITRQKGDFLVEALVGILLMAVIGTGVVYITSRVEVSKRDMAVQDIVVNTLRSLLMNNGVGGVNLCDLSDEQRRITLPKAATSTSVSYPYRVIGCNTTATAQVNGVSVSGFQKPLVLKISLDGDATFISVGGIDAR